MLSWQNSIVLLIKIPTHSEVNQELEPEIYGSLILGFDKLSSKIEDFESLTNSQDLNNLRKCKLAMFKVTYQGWNSIKQKRNSWHAKKIFRRQLTWGPHNDFELSTSLSSFHEIAQNLDQETLHMRSMKAPSKCCKPSTKLKLSSWKIKCKGKLEWTSMDKKAPGQWEGSFIQVLNIRALNLFTVKV